MAKPKPKRTYYKPQANQASAPAWKFRLPDGTQSAKSPWIWRGLFFMSLIAIGLCLTLVVGGHTLFAALWAVIAAGWFGASMWLWRQNVRYMDMS
jgi:hypothetical protein